MSESTRTRIATIETIIMTTELEQEFKIAGVEASKIREHVLVRITDDQGNQGFGEASPLEFLNGETSSITKFAIDQYLAPISIGQEVHALSELHRTWNKLYPGYLAAKCALDIALHDLIARIANITIADLLGGSSSPSLPIYRAIVFGTPEDTLQDGEKLWDLGLRSIKLKVGDTLARDIANLKALRERFGDDLEIILDGNEGYTAPQAVRLLRETWQYNVAYIEQPVSRHDVAGLAFVRAHGGVPVMADESLFSLRDAFNLIRAEAVDLFGIKLIKTAGFTTARQIAALAHEYDIKCVVISPFDTEIGIAANAMLASTFPAQPESQGLGTHFAVTDMTTSPLHLEGGRLLLPKGSGLGVDIDPTIFEGSIH